MTPHKHQLFMTPVIRCKSQNRRMIFPIFFYPVINIQKCLYILIQSFQGPAPFRSEPVHHIVIIAVIQDHKIIFVTFYQIQRFLITFLYGRINKIINISPQKYPRNTVSFCRDDSCFFSCSHKIVKYRVYQKDRLSIFCNPMFFWRKSRIHTSKAVTGGYAVWIFIRSCTRFSNPANFFWYFL